MRAVHIRAFGTPGIVLEVAELREPAGQVLIGAEQEVALEVGRLGIPPDPEDSLAPHLPLPAPGLVHGLDIS